MIQPTSATQPRDGLVSQLLPTLMTIQKALEHLIGNQTTQAPVPTPTPLIVELVLDEPVQGTTPVNADNLSVAR